MAENKDTSAVRVDIDHLDEAIDDAVDPRKAEALDVIRRLMVKFALMGHSSSKDGKRKVGARSIISFMLASIGVWELSDEVPTMQVEMRGDAVLRLRCGIDFLLTKGVEIGLRGLTHEMEHILYPVWARKGGDIVFLDERAKDPLYKNYALEYWINNEVMKIFGDKRMLDVGDDGEPIGLMDPDKAYAKVKEVLKDQAPSRADFLISPETVYTWLKKLPAPPKQRNQGGCSHDHGQGDGGDGEPGDGGSSGNNGGVDTDEAEAIVDTILDTLMERALRGDEVARDALLDVGETLGGEGGKWWSEMGMGRLLGKPVPSARVRYWEAFLHQAMGSRLAPGVAMTYPRKEAGLAPFYDAIGSAIPLRPMGKEHEKTAWVFFDTSGSMPRALVDRCAALMGEVEGCEMKWHTFSDDVHAIEDPSMFEYTVGGTSFTRVDEFISSHDDDLPDAILIVTDGYAPRISPTWADLAVWLITEGGDTWPEDAGMTCILTDIPSNDV